MEKTICFVPLRLAVRSVSLLSFLETLITLAIYNVSRGIFLRCLCELFLRCPIKDRSVERNQCSLSRTGLSRRSSIERIDMSFARKLTSITVNERSPINFIVEFRNFSSPFYRGRGRPSRFRDPDDSDTRLILFFSFFFFLRNVRARAEQSDPNSR